MEHDIRNPYNYTWVQDGDAVKLQVDFEKVIRETVRQMVEMEEQARLKVVVEYLRGIGYFIREPDGTYK